MNEGSHAECDDCGRPYGEENGFPDLIIPLEEWRQISPTGDEGGLLCPCCILSRLHKAGLSRVPGSFMSGPIDSIDYHSMWSYRMTENMMEREEKRLKAEKGTA